MNLAISERPSPCNWPGGGDSEKRGGGEGNNRLVGNRSGELADGRLSRETPQSRERGEQAARWETGSSSLSSENNREQDLMMFSAESRRSRNRCSCSACGSAVVRTELLQLMSLLLLPIPSKGVIVG